MGYPSDVSDREWAEIKRFFEPEHSAALQTWCAKPV